MKIYLVLRSTGSYDDYFEYVVRAYKDKEVAENIVENYNQRLFKLTNYFTERYNKISANKVEERSRFFSIYWDLRNINEFKIQETELK